MRIGSLFSGIGGLELGLEWAGVGHTAWQVEREPFCRVVLAKNWPGVRRFDDVRQVGSHNLERVEVICGGFPCQDISYAGRGAGLAGEESALWWEFARVIGEMGPRYVVVENVAALLGRGMGDVLGTLSDLGYDAEWSAVSACSVGAPHTRERVFIIAHAERDIEPRTEPRLGSPGRVGRERQPVAWDGGWEAALRRIRGVDDGLSRCVERTDALRNAVVPQVAEVVGRRLLAIHRSLTERAA